MEKRYGHKKNEYTEVKSASTHFPSKSVIPDPSQEFPPQFPSSIISFAPSRLVADLADQELRGLAACLITVGQVGCGDGKGTGADEIARCAKDLKPVRWVAGDSTTILEVLGVSEQDSADNLFTRSGIGISDSGCC
jgi:hypothetical protein